LNKLKAEIQNKRELKLERTVNAPVELVWRCWTEPEHLKQWYCPKPYQTSQCTIDLRVGGVFSTVLKSPEAEEFPYSGIYLEIKPLERIVYTDAFDPGWEPRENPWPFFTVFIDMKDAGAGKTRYTARAVHWSEEGARKHEEMGFHDGWGKALEQLEEHTLTMR